MRIREKAFGEMAYGEMKIRGNLHENVYTLG